MEALTDESKGRLREEPYFELLLEYNDLVEELRKRLNILSTSFFLLAETSDKKDPRVLRYLGKINQEMEKIRQLILPFPKNVTAVDNEERNNLDLIRIADK